jgi:hypothetical protein
VTSTQETSFERRKGTETSHAASDVTITAKNKADQEPRTPPTGMPQREVILRQTREWVSTLRDPVPSPVSTRTSDASDTRPPFLSPIPEGSAAPSIPPRNQRRALRTIKTPARFSPNNPQMWKAPDAWDCSPTSATFTPSPRESRSEACDGGEGDVSMTLVSMQSEARRRTAASPDIILRRLKEEWRFTGDATLYKETEMEKKRWMLTALFEEPRRAQTLAPPGKNLKVLALYESQGKSKPPRDWSARRLDADTIAATTSYLAARFPGQTIHHLSPSPLSSPQFPNVVPISAPVMTPSTMTFAMESFSEAFSLTLPAMITSAEIPPMLRTVARCLGPKGIFHLTLIDSSPIEATTGPHMRAWLSENLLINLERQFRCTKPSVLLPVWLDEADLRGEGSTITTASFDAVPLAVGDKAMSAKAEAESKDQADEVRTRLELRSHVGRMLWQEVWGAFVTADKWWWDLPECTKECEELGTRWQYSLIGAVKRA